LQWCVDNVEKAPPGGWLREVYFQLARLASAEGDKTKSEEYLRRSGYTDFNKPIVLMTPFSEDRERGHAFAAWRSQGLLILPRYTCSAIRRSAISRESRMRAGARC
jgi:hypothetical protein